MAAKAPHKYSHLFAPAFVAGAGLVLAFFSILFSLWDYRIHLRAIVDPRFTTVPEFALQDSLPALEGGLSNLEAFKLIVTPSKKANPDRSVWIAPSLERLVLEYHTDKRLFDSVTMMVWTSDSVLEMKTFTKPQALWDIPLLPPKNHWMEVVGVYVSRPSLLTFRSMDSSIALFEQVEGKVFHVIRGRYHRRTDKVVPPDTSYAIQDTTGGIQLMVRGNALAVLNSTSDTVRIRVIATKESRWNNLVVNPQSIQVYRKLLVGVRGPILAYTYSGGPFKNPSHPEEEPSAFFALFR